MSDITFLLSLKPFEPLAKSDAQRLLAKMKERTFQPREEIMRVGDPGDSMFVVVSGTVHVRVPDDEGNIRFETHLGKGDIFGEMAVFTGEARNADIFAGEESVVCLEITREELDALINENPDVAVFLTEILNERIQVSKTLSRVGQYHILGVLGAGGMATVFEGYHPILQIPVAIKMLGHGLARRKGFMDRFREEGKLLGQLRHPGIVRIYDFEEGYGTCFIMMERLKGTDLACILEERPRLDFSVTRQILIQVARALHHAHEQGVVHRDVKPNNVFLEPSGRAKLVDFGIATADMTAPDEDAIYCSPEYAAPEVIQRLDVDRRADIYSLGIMAFQMVAGRLPFIADDVTVQLALQLTQPLPDLDEAAPGIPADLKAFIEKATAKDPSGRYATADEVKDALLVGLRDRRTGKKKKIRIDLLYTADDDESAQKLVAAIRQLVEDFPQVQARIK